jgi:hypothetical protein
MSGNGNTGDKDKLFFHPVLKCCTYLPEIPNFSVGRILEDSDPQSIAGRRTVEGRIKRGIAVSPLGLRADARARLLYDAGIEHGAFGRAEALRCPHLLADGRCGIWRFREAVCTTWFCKHERGATGYNFWQSLRELLRLIEQSLALWCLLQLDFPPQLLERLLGPPDRKDNKGIPANELDQHADFREHKAIWGEWAGREQELYRSCALLVTALEWRQVLQISGPAVEARARLVVNNHRMMRNDALPERLTVGTLRLVQISGESVNITSYSEFDPVKINRPLYEALPYFDGVTVEEARQAIHDEKGIRVSHTVLRQLIDRRILVPEEGSSPTTDDTPSEPELAIEEDRC